MNATTAPDGYRCIVIGPIGNALAPVDSPDNIRYVEAMEVFGSVVEPACQHFHITPIRADAMRKPGEIPTQVYEALRDWELVIADMTDANPNVVYELALRHLTGRCVISIGEYGRLPFDVQHIRTEQFVRTEAGLVAGRKKLVGAIEAVLTLGCDPLTVERVFAGAAETHDRRRSPPADSSAEVALDTAAARDEMGFLDILAEAEDAMPQMTATLEAMSELIKKIGALFEQGTAEVQAAQATGQTTARDGVIFAARVASSLEQPAADLEALVTTYAAQMTRVDRGVTYLLDQMDANPALVDEATEWISTLLELRSNTESNMATAESFAQSVQGLGSISRVLRPPVSRISMGIRQTTATNQRVLEWGQRIDAIKARPRVH